MASQHQSLLQFGERQTPSSSNLESSPASRKRLHRPWLWVITSQVPGLLWLVLITCLLYLNFTRYTVGTSVWCPRGCHVNQLSDNAIQRTRQLDQNDHNTLGVLQFVAKALEVLFVFVATSLVYNVATIFASRAGGLPIGYLMTHLKFTDLRSLIDPLLWTTPHTSARTIERKRKLTFNLYFFAVFVAFMCILANLMGPAIAVLVLPTLQYKDTTNQFMQQFHQMGLSAPPTGAGAISNCSSAALAARSYSCTSNIYAASMDS